VYSAAKKSAKPYRLDQWESVNRLCPSGGEVEGDESSAYEIATIYTLILLPKSTGLPPEGGRQMRAIATHPKLVSYDPFRVIRDSTASSCIA